MLTSFHQLSSATAPPPPHTPQFHLLRLHTFPTACCSLPSSLSTQPRRQMHTEVGGSNVRLSCGSTLWWALGCFPRAQPQWLLRQRAALPSLPTPLHAPMPTGVMAGAPLPPAAAAIGTRHRRAPAQCFVCHRPCNHLHHCCWSAQCGRLKDKRPCFGFSCQIVITISSQSMSRLSSNRASSPPGMPAMLSAMLVA